ncbi:hypothetical protein HF313_19090 [Massilia atriviolacea]|uniref:hypothetical protein n=1 Tax=Massilia atriviolacea TaxID=2495579 RepID=UPI0013E0BD09|nr:hypothetical protein [Massilia atriviolacea]
MYGDKLEKDERPLAGILIVVCGIAAVSVAAFTVLFGLEQAGLVDLQNLTSYPHYRLR